MRCKQCGREGETDARFCPECGADMLGEEHRATPGGFVVITCDTIPGLQFEPVGIVSGSTVQSVHLGKDILASFKARLLHFLY